MRKTKNNAQPRLSIIIPIYNEASTIQTVLSEIKKTRLQKMEVIVVDDGSTDQSRQLLFKLRKKISHLILQPKNLGKGAAIRAGLAAASGEVVIIQDADLEYSPQDYSRLIQPILDGKADVVYGSRFVGSQPHRVVYFWHYLGNILLTLLSNIITNLNLTDMETGFKAFRLDIIKQITLEQNRFGFEPEVTIKLAQKKVRFYEVGVTYHGRTYEEGKKIGLTDFFEAIWVLLKYGIIRVL